MASTRTPGEITDEILSRLDVAAEFGALGVRISGTPRPSGMVSCFALDREDRKPSAWINVKSGYYGDSGGKDAPAFTCSLFDLAVRAGQFPDWRAARKAYAEKASMTIGKERRAAGSAKTDWHEKLELQSWNTPGNNVLLLRWCREFKSGTTPEAVKAAGGQLAYYPCWIDKKTGEKRRTRDCHQVVAIPCYGSWLLDSDPVAWVIWDVCGREFDVTPRGTPPSEPRITAKMLSIGPTSGAMMGLSSLMAICDPERRDNIDIAWKVEGPADMLALWSVIPEIWRGKAVVLTAAGGATAEVYPHQSKLFAGLKTAIVPDCDEAGVVGAEKWCRSLHGITAETRIVRLPWEIQPKHGEDVRDFLTGKSGGPRDYADLLKLWDQVEQWKPAAAGEATSAEDRPDQATLDYHTDSEIARAMQIDVLGQREDGTIEIWSMHLERSVAVKNLSQLKYPDMLRLFGTPVRRCISKNNEDEAPGFYPIADAREAIGHLASRRIIHDETKHGVGCWPVEDGGEEPAGVLAVNASRALSYTADGSIGTVRHPRHAGQLLAFGSAEKPWYDHDHLAELLKSAKDPTFRAAVVNELCGLFSRWRWKSSHSPLVATGLVLATWVQTIWPWRPRIDILGGSNTGKSMLCGALAGMYGDLAILTSDTTAAGLRQKICNSAFAVIVDEVDAKNRAKLARQREILEMLRSASRGTSAIRGTGTGKAQEFTLRHLVWVAGISINYDDQADRNRAIRLDLLPPLAGMAGKLTVPPAVELYGLGQRSLATALFCALRARKHAGDFRGTKVAGVDQRAIESLSVPAAMLGTAIEWDGLSPTELLTEMVEIMRDDSGPIESDEQSLISDILNSEIRLERYTMTVAEAVEHVWNPLSRDRTEWKKKLAGAGIQLKLGKSPGIGFAYTMVRRKLLRGTRWEDQPLEQYLKRVGNCTSKKVRIGSQVAWACVFPLEWFCNEYMGEDEDDDRILSTEF